jgi:hypothetical protein
VAEAADLQLPPGAVTVGWLHRAHDTATSATMLFGVSNAEDGIGRQPAVQVEGEHKGGRWRRKGEKYWGAGGGLTHNVNTVGPAIIQTPSI